jgi:hypothetical protein
MSKFWNYRHVSGPCATSVRSSPMVHSPKSQPDPPLRSPQTVWWL